MKVEGVAVDYFNILANKQKLGADKKVVLFLGASIGNYKDKEAVDLIKKIGEFMNEKDSLMLGLDRKKDPRIIWEAYNILPC